MHGAVVTTKLGQAASSWVSKQKAATKMADALVALRRTRVYPRELLMAIFLYATAAYGMWTQVSLEALSFVALQGTAFVAFGLGLVDVHAASDLLSNDKK